MKPLEGYLIVDFSQFLSAPSASLRLADLGARVIKVERPGCGDICRELYVSDVVLDGDSTVFHAINRNKESLAADLKQPSTANSYGGFWLGVMLCPQLSPLARRGTARLRLR